MKILTEDTEELTVAITSMFVKVTIIRSVKLSTSKNNEKNPTRTKVKVCKNVLVTWYIIRLRKTTFAIARLILLTEVVFSTTNCISYSTNSVSAENRRF